MSSPEVNASSTCIYSLSLLGSIDSGIFPLHSFLGRKPAFTSEQQSEKHYACSNRICVHFDECCLKHLSSSSDRGLRKNIKGCFDRCKTRRRRHLNRRRTRDRTSPKLFITSSARNRKIKYPFSWSNSSFLLSRR